MSGLLQDTTDGVAEALHQADFCASFERQSGLAPDKDGAALITLAAEVRRLQAAQRAYALRMKSGHWVGIWNDRATAEHMRSRYRDGDKYEIVEFPQAAQREPQAQRDDGGLSAVQAGILLNALLAMEEVVACDPTFDAHYPKTRLLVDDAINLARSLGVSEKVAGYSPGMKDRHPRRDDHPTEGLFRSREEQDRWVDRTPRGQFYLRQQARMRLAEMIVEEILSGDESGLGGDYETDLHHKLAQVMELIPDAALAASKGTPDSMGQGQPLPSLSVDTSVADRKDAARYRWLRAQARPVNESDGGVDDWELPWIGNWHYRPGAELNERFDSFDAAIDAAMSADVRSQAKEKP